MLHVDGCAACVHDVMSTCHGGDHLVVMMAPLQLQLGAPRGGPTRQTGRGRRHNPGWPAAGINTKRLQTRVSHPRELAWCYLSAARCSSMPARACEGASRATPSLLVFSLAMDKCKYY